MSKFLTTGVLLLASFVAFAIPSYWAAIETTAYDKASGSGDGDKDNYTLYYCTAELAADHFGGTSVSAIESYLNVGRHFSEVKAMATYDSVAFSDGEYHILDYTLTAFTVADYVAIAFYSSEAYRVYGLNSAVLTPNDQLVFNESYATSGSVGAWQQAVPEPTGGLLLLIGMAGLALRRRKI